MRSSVLLFLSLSLSLILLGSSFVTESEVPVWRTCLESGFPPTDSGLASCVVALGLPIDLDHRDPVTDEIRTKASDPIMEDSPDWDCRTMGNRTCGPVYLDPVIDPHTPTN